MSEKTSINRLRAWAIGGDGPTGYGNASKELGHDLLDLLSAYNASQEQAKQMELERDMLAKAIREAAVTSGHCGADHSLTGPQLVMICADMADFANGLVMQIKAAGLEIGAEPPVEPATSPQ